MQHHCRAVGGGRVPVVGRTGGVRPPDGRVHPQGPDTCAAGLLAAAGAAAGVDMGPRRRSPLTRASPWEWEGWQGPPQPPGPSGAHRRGRQMGAIDTVPGGDLCSGSNTHTHKKRTSTTEASSQTTSASRICRTADPRKVHNPKTLDITRGWFGAFLLKKRRNKRWKKYQEDTQWRTEQAICVFWNGTPDSTQSRGYILPVSLLLSTPGSKPESKPDPPLPGGRHQMEICTWCKE